MVSREHKKAAAAELHEKLQLLRSITNSHADNKTSIVIDASKYIKELKRKVEKLNQDIDQASAQTSSHDQNPLPMVAVETLENGYLINVCSDKSCPGLLVPVLEAFEELSLNVLEARVSCTDSFQLEAIGGENKDDGGSVDAQVLRQAVMQAINRWSKSIN